ncbi:type VII secretion protein EccE [Streptomyces sp. NPDC005811]|uniref:type VII secretion protein EccE n=1 Tax=Streptomyces sp. NPDC005811 TaxID=3154565 RepID=UPI0033ECC51A
MVATAIVVLSVARRRGRSLPERRATARALKARRRPAAKFEIPPGTEPGFGPALKCDPSLRTYEYGGRDRSPVGIVGDGTFVTAVLQVEADATALRADRNRRPLPLNLVRDALDVDGIRLESAQIVLHTQPAPALHLPPQSVAVTNYAPLQEQTGAPAVRLTWIALKLDPEPCPEAVAARGGGFVGAQKCVVRAADHLVSRLTGAGFRSTVLAEEQLTTALATSACADHLVTAEAGRTGTLERRTEESSRNWRCDNRRHTTYRMRRWPTLGGADAPTLPQFIALVTAVPALATTFSVTLARGKRQDVSLSAHIRIGGLWTAQVLALRAAATGARVAVEPGRPQAWAQMVHAMGGGQNGLAVHEVGRVPPQGASTDTPVLVVRDCGMRPPRGRVVSGPWQSVLTLLPYLSPVAPRLIRQARLVGVQRISPDEALEVGRALTLPRENVEALPTLVDGFTLWCADRDRQYVMTRPTDAEIGLLGSPRRMD